MTEATIVGSGLEGTRTGGDIVLARKFIFVAFVDY